MIELAIVAVVVIIVLVYVLHLGSTEVSWDIEEYLDLMDDEDRADEYMYKIMMGEFNND